MTPFEIARPTFETHYCARTNGDLKLAFQEVWPIGNDLDRRNNLGCLQLRRHIYQLNLVYCCSRSGLKKYDHENQFMHSSRQTDTASGVSTSSDLSNGMEKRKR
jgi:hypothetical protein